MGSRCTCRLMAHPIYNLPRVEGEGTVRQCTHNSHIQGQEAHATLGVLDPAVGWDGIADVSQAEGRRRAQVIAAILQLQAAGQKVGFPQEEAEHDDANPGVSNCHYMSKCSGKCMA